ncbi:class I SAM-dependent methyltransferase [Pseudoxanthomonas wuyuanensis]|uniref:Methyltransferase domain-containing protein n=1 Tax=Pseudoxanthomonas wuyuanensis TaxID=1073196 RepID=A0A286DA46_9GAMM|nr:methyltransferase domain-containing protein [Pseudoxanthomonas wuyuanensis]KAF1720517.1 methyltransferase domain-containing protein [Pseudoxanthomonas wuyuanensis]SOD55520.1 Methyltransferase domain-containing protein [Pseudoxanthomonas wuyuanensis]
MGSQSSGQARHMEEQRRQWDSVAAGWKKWWPVIEAGAQYVSERMLELAEVAPGQRVLDIATGIGEPALLAASRVGPVGRVVATDRSSQMLDIARERASGLGLRNVDFMEADAERLDFPDRSFDAVLWRWGLTDLPNPLDTLVAIRRMLTPDGSFVTAVWEAGPRARPLASLAAAVAREMFDSPSPRAAHPPLPGSVEKALQDGLTRAGFSDVRVEEMTLTLEFPSAEDCIRYLMEVSPAFAALLSGKSPGQQQRYRQTLADRLRQYLSVDGGIRIPNATICAVGRR